MSTQNGRRSIGHGVGGGNASIDNVAFSPGAWAGWIDDDNGFFANGSDAWISSIYTVSTKTIRRAIEDKNDPQYQAGFNHGFAGGGGWAAWLGSRDEQRGLYTSWGLHLPDAGLLGMGPNRELGYKPLYQSDGPTLCREPDGSEWPITMGHATDLKLLGSRRAVWREATTIKVSGSMPLPKQLGDAYNPNAHLINGRWWVSYFSTIAGIVLHPFDDSSMGYTIVGPGIDRWHSAQEYGDEVQFALFATEAEQDGWLERKVVKVGTDPMHELRPPDKPLILPPMKRPIWNGWFEFRDGTPSPGNAALLVRNFSGQQKLPIIVTDETAAVCAGDILGWFFGGRSVDEIEARAPKLEHRPIAYWDANKWPRWPKLPKGSWCCVRMYMPKTVSYDTFEQDCREQLLTAPPGLPIVMVPQQYTSNADFVGYVPPTTPTPHDSGALKQLAPMFVKMANDFSNVVAIMFFSGNGRVGGLQDHPDIRQPWQDWASQIVQPKWVDYPPVVPPDPKPPSDLYHRAKEYTMSATEVGAVKGPGNKFGRVLHSDAGKGPFGWYPVLFDRDTPDDDCWFELSRPDSRHALRHTKITGLFGGDATENSNSIPKQFYLKPGDDRGILESPVLIHDPASDLIVGYFTWPEKICGGPAFIWVKR